MKIVGVCPPAINGHGRCYYWWSVRPRSASILYFMLPVYVCVYIRSHCTCMCHTHSIPTCDTFQGQRARFHASQGFFPSGEVHWSPHRQGGVCVGSGWVGLLLKSLRNLKFLFNSKPFLLILQLFYLVASSYQMYCNSVELLRQRGMDIYWTFFLDHSPLELGVDEGIKQRIGGGIMSIPTYTSKWGKI